MAKKLSPKAKLTVRVRERLIDEAHVLAKGKKGGVGGVVETLLETEVAADKVARPALYRRVRRVRAGRPRIVRPEPVPFVPAVQPEASAVAA